MSDTKPTENQTSDNPVDSETMGPDAVTRSKLPDFRPLGTIRDYFTEQMKQDSIR